MLRQVNKVEYTNLNFGPFVLKTKVSDYIIDRLKADGENLKVSYNDKLAGHLDHQFLYTEETRKWFYTEISPIINAYREGHCKFHNIQDLTVEIRPYDLWVNYMKAGDFNPIHHHGGDYTFVLYLDVPDELKKEQGASEATTSKPGGLIFEYGNYSRPRWDTTNYNIIPETGDMYMFPAMLQHWVAPFKSKVTRISVSGNLEIVNWNKLPGDYF